MVHVSLLMWHQFPVAKLASYLFQWLLVTIQDFNSAIALLGAFITPELEET